MHKITGVMGILAILFLGIIALSYVNSIIRARAVQTYSCAHFDKDHKPIILWDIHDVILRKDKGAMLGLIFNLNTKKAILARSSYSMIKDIFAAFYIAFKTGSTGEEFVGIAYKHDNAALAHAIITIANDCQRVMPDTAALIKELHAYGYRQHIGSNIGEQIFQDLLQRSLFSDLFNDTIFDISASQVVSYDPVYPERTIKKPQKAFYETYLKKNNLAANQVILIDDKVENVLSAQQVGMYGIVFKNAGQLRKDLWCLLGLSAHELALARSPCLSAEALA